MPDLFPESTGVVDTPLPQVVVRTCGYCVLLGDMLLERVKLGGLGIWMSPKLDRVSRLTVDGVDTVGRHFVLRSWGEGERC